MATPSDLELAAIVEERVARDLPNAIQVAASGGVITLRGVVAHLPAARRAIDTATRVREVRGVIDAIDVLPGARPDATIEREIADQLATHAALDSLALAVVAEDGAVVLGGDVRSLAEAALVIEAAEAVRGVRSVTSALRIAPRAPLEDGALVRAIVDRIRADSRIDAGLVQVHAVAGHVHLEGAVSSERERRLLGRLAAIEGARTIDTSAIEIAPWAPGMARIGRPPSDVEIEAAIEASIEHDPRICRDAIEVSVERGEVVLAGSVHSVAAGRAAVEDAGTILGVRGIDETALRVIPDPLLADLEIDERVSEALARSPWIEDAIEIEVRGGHVVLRGTIDRPSTEEEALGIVSTIAGVRSIDDRLELASR